MRRNINVYDVWGVNYYEEIDIIDEIKHRLKLNISDAGLLEDFINTLEKQDHQKLTKISNILSEN